MRRIRSALPKPLASVIASIGIDVLVMPGGGNTLAQMKDPEVIDFIREAGEKARYVTSVCTGTLILAEAGLLDGYEAATHWAYRDVLES